MSPDDASLALGALARAFPGLLAQLTWQSCSLPPEQGHVRKLHLGAGNHLLPDFVNVDYLPQDHRVFKWNLLHPWDDALSGHFDFVFSEDVLEHFFLNEQIYILASINRALRQNGTKRVLMPSLKLLMDYAIAFELAELDRRKDFMVTAMRMRSAADAMNLGMRFGGHRWLHDQASLELLAANTGFRVTRTSCAESTVPELSGLNIRDESTSISFANDLHKVRPVERLRLPPAAIEHAERLAGLPSGATLYRATAHVPQVHYVLAEPLPVTSIILINIRSGNFAESSNHSMTQLSFNGHADACFFVDASLRSVPYMNTASQAQLTGVVAPTTAIDRVSFIPVHGTGLCFSLGDLEIFHFGDAGGSGSDG